MGGAGRGHRTRAVGFDGTAATTAADDTAAAATNAAAAAHVSDERWAAAGRGHRTRAVGFDGTAATAADDTAATAASTAATTAATRVSDERRRRDEGGFVLLALRAPRCTRTAVDFVIVDCQRAAFYAACQVGSSDLFGPSAGTTLTR